MQPPRESNHEGQPQNWWDAARNWVLSGVRRSRRSPRIGLALGGGFARGIAHIGILRAFERNNIPIHAVAGVSAGAMVAAAYASGGDSAHIEQIALSMKLRDVARWTISLRGFAQSERMIPFLARLLKATRFEDMKIPLAIVATDLNVGKPVVFKDAGDAVLPIRASCAYPGLYLPIQDGKRFLVDGFVTMEVPALPLRRMGCTHVISVKIPSPADSHDFDNMFAVVNRCFQVMGSRTEPEWKRHSNLVISPAVDDLAWDCFASAKTLIERGEKAGLEAIPAIKKWLVPTPADTPVETSSVPLPV